MKKALKRVISFALAAIMALGMTTVTFAADGVAADISAATIQGKSIAEAVAASMSEYGDAVADSIQLELLPRELTYKSGDKIVVLTGGANAKAWLLTAAQDVAVVDAIGDTIESGGDLSSAIAAAGGTDATAAAGAAGTLTPGDVIWIYDGTEADTDEVVFLRVVINQASGGTIGGGSSVKNAIINVVVPTKLDFALDPLQISQPSDDSQIATADYRFANKSNTPVQVSLIVEATLVGTTLVSNPAALKPSDPTAKTKNAYFAILGAQTVTTGVPTFLDPTLGTMTYNKSLTGTLVPFSTGATKTASIDFVLDKATGTPIDTLAASNAGIASFQFYGIMNTYAPWKANDITVSGDYTLQAMRGDDYTALTAAEKVGLNILKPVISEAPTDDITVVDGVPASLNLGVGGTLTLNATAAVVEGVTTTYEWYKDGSPIVPAATSAIYSKTTLAKSDSGTYTVYITNTSSKAGALPTTTTKECVVAVLDPSAEPVIGTNIGTSKTLTVGDPLTLTVAATGSTLTYQWYKGTTEISGATSATYSIPSVVLGDAGSYKVTVTNTDGVKAPTSLDSDICAVTVNPPVGFTGAGSTPTSMATYTYSKATVTGDYTIPFYYGGLTVTSFKTPPGAELVLGTDYNVTANAFVITQSRLLAVGVGPTAKTFTITLSDNSTYAVNLITND